MAAEQFIFSIKKTQFASFSVVTQLENKRVESLPYSSNDQNKVDERFTFIYCV